MDATTGLQQRLVAAVSRYGSTLVAFSGGVDSTVVARAAREALGDRAVAAVSDSPTMPRSELAAARQVARSIGIRLEVVERNELDDPRFVANPTDRCFFCKSGLVEDLARVAGDLGLATVSLGVTRSDLGDWRPGIEASRRAGAFFPLVEAGLDKSAVRHVARHWGLPVWDKPASPCLSSRIPYGQVVTLEKLGRIERAEELVRSLGFRDVRVRHIGGDARVEVPAKDVPRLEDHRSRLTDALTLLGFDRVSLDGRGLVSGRLNQEHPGQLRPTA